MNIPEPNTGLGQLVMAEIAEGEAQIARGEYVTIDQLIRREIGQLFGPGHYQRQWQTDEGQEAE